MRMLRGGVLERGSNKGPNTDTVLDMGQFGVRVAAAPGVLPVRLVPYVEVLTGLGYWRGGVSVTRQDGNHLFTQVVGGGGPTGFRSRLTGGWWSSAGGVWERCLGPSIR